MMLSSRGVVGVRSKVRTTVSTNADTQISFDEVGKVFHKEQVAGLGIDEADLNEVDFGPVSALDIEVPRRIW